MKQKMPHNTPHALTIDERFLTEADKAKVRGKDENSVEFAAVSAAMTARAMLTPEVTSATIVQDLLRQPSVDSLVDELRQQTALVQGGSLERPKAMLMAQAQALDALFLTLCKRSLANAREGGFLDAADKYMRLALRAQSQSVRTLEVLGELVNPRPVAYVRQANIAHTQQVNNHPAWENQKTEIQTISKDSHELHPDTSTPRIEVGTDSPVATLATLNRAKVGAGQEKG